MEFPAVFSPGQITLPKGYGPSVERALHGPLLLTKENDFEEFFLCRDPGLAGCVLQSVRDLGITAEGRVLRITFLVGRFGLKSLVEELNLWASHTHGLTEILDRKLHGEPFVLKEQSTLSVDVLMNDSAETVSISVYSEEIRAEVKTVRRQARGQSKLCTQLARSQFETYRVAKVHVVQALAGMVKQGYPGVDKDGLDSMALLAANTMTGEYDAKPLERLTPEQQEAATSIAVLQLRSNTLLRDAAFHAGHNLALSHLSLAVDVDHGIVDNHAVSVAIHVLERLIEHADNPANYLATLAQCYFSKRDNAKAHEIACRAVAADSTNPEAWRLKGNGEWSAENRREALASYQQAEKLSPSPLMGVAEAIAMIHQELARGAPEGR